MIVWSQLCHGRPPPVFPWLETGVSVRNKHVRYVVQFGREAILLFGAWVEKALKRYFVFEIKQECSVPYIVSVLLLSTFHSIYFYDMWLVLTFVCCDSNILLFTQKISAPASLSAGSRMRTGMHVYYIPGMVCGPCVLMMRSNSLTSFWFLERIWLVH